MYDALTQGHPSFAAWLDKKYLQAGIPWDTQIDRALRPAASVLFVMTPASVKNSSECTNEWAAGLQYKKPVLPLLVHPGAEIPYGLNKRREHIDFSTDFDAGLERLRKELTWIESPKGLLEAARHRLNDARDMLGLTTLKPQEHQRWRQEIESLEAEVRRLQAIVDDPQAAVIRTEQRVVRGIESERQPRASRNGTVRSRVINSPPYRVRLDLFHDRTDETKRVTALLRNDGVRLITVVGRGGAGKTALVLRLLELLESGQDGDGVPFADIVGIVYLSALGTQHLLADKLFLDIARLLPDEVAGELHVLYRNPQIPLRDKMQALLDRFTTGSVIVLIDNFEDIVDPRTETITNQGLLDELRAFLELAHHAVKLIITTRVLPTDLQRINPTRQDLVKLGEGLPSPFAEDFLRKLDEDGTAGLRTAPPDLLTQAQLRTRGFPKALEALYFVLAQDPTTSLQAILDKSATYLPEDVIEDFVGEAFSRLDVSAAQVVQALAVFEQPVPLVAVDYILKPFFPTIDSAPLLGRLLKRYFVRRNEQGRYFLHPVERQYALGQIPLGTRADNRLSVPPFTQFALRNLAADFFHKAWKDRSEWRTLEDLEPQFAEIELRHLAGEHDEAAAIVCDIHYRYLYVWGCYRQMIDLHERLRDTIADTTLKEYSLRHLGIAYAEMGRVQEAIKVTSESLAMAHERHNVNGEVLDLGNLGTYYRDLGDTQRALDYYTQAWETNRSQDTYFQAVHSTYLGECYAYQGDFARAADILRKGVLLARAAGDQPFETFARGLLCQVLVDLDRYREAVGEATEAVLKAKDLGSLKLLYVCNIALFRAHLALDDLPRARRAAEEAVKSDYPIENHLSYTCLAVAALRSGDAATAQSAFTDALEAADQALEFNPRLFHALDSRGLSLAARQLCGEPPNLEGAVEAHRRARSINRDEGVRRRVASLYRALAPVDPNDSLARARDAADGTS